MGVRPAGPAGAEAVTAGTRDDTYRVLERVCTAESSSERMDAFVAMVRWTRHGREWSAPGESPSEAPGAVPSRLEELVTSLENDGELRRRYRDAVGALIAESEGTNVFAHAGIPSERGTFAELGERLMNHVLPRPRDDRDLATLFRRLFRSTGDVDRLSRIPLTLFERLVRLHGLDWRPEAWEGLRRSFANGFRLLATWTQAQGLSPKLRKRSRPTELTASPFYRLAGASESVVALWLRGGVPAEEAESWRLECARCREEVAEIHRRIELEGVSIHVVYGLEVVERCLTRMEAMVDLMTASTARGSVVALHRLLGTLAASVHDDRSVLHLLWWSTHLLQRRIVERSGRTGEHYIASTHAEYRHMWLAAAGGGLLTVGTAAIKTVVSGWPGSDFAHGLLYGLNYAVSFLLLQRFGLVLATKQPAMTAAALAAIVRERRGAERADEIIEYAARICRSQLAATIANVLVVAAGAAALVKLWGLLFGRPFLAAAEASAVYEGLSPVNSGTVFYAALTGVILWMASVVGGWFDNFCAYHRLPLALAQHPAGRRLGRERLERWGDALSRNAAGWATNVALGFMLGMTPAIGHFLGLPLDVRHVTLNSGVLSLAGASLGEGWFGEGMFLRGVVGVAVMFVLNLSVSFVLALATAGRAYELPAPEVGRLLRSLYRRFVTSPRDFLVPPRRDPAPIGET
jgi:site-specific recombinase